MLLLDIYPNVLLSVVRKRPDPARRQVAGGVNRGARRKAEKAAAQHTTESFGRHGLAQQARYAHKR
jgi:hypothetical protein